MINSNKNASHPRGWDMKTLKKMDVKVWSYLEEYEKEKEEILSAIEEVLKSGTLILGDNVKTFEEKFSNYCGVKYGVGVNSCTDALFLALKALNIGQGDEVITVANTAVPTVAAIAATGATARFVDIDPETYLMDVTQIEQVITEKTKCILPVHLYGQCADMDELTAVAKKNELKIIEDCAQAHGALYKGRNAGSLSDISAFSFYPTKVLGGYGDAGMVLTNDESLYQRVRGLRVYGMKGTYYSYETGYNSRLDEIHAAILLKKLAHIEVYIEKRNMIAKQYKKFLSDTSLALPKVLPHNKSVFYIYVCRHPKRDKIISGLKERGIFVNISYEWPIHTMKAYKYLGYKEGDLPFTEAACREVFSLPMYPFLTYSQQEKVSEALHNILKEIDAEPI
jgi:aminotransferase EvaB